MWIRGIIGVLFIIILEIDAHSWVGCTDYRGDVSDYDDSKCYGYPRSWANARGASVGTGYNLGIDTGFNFQGSSCNLPITNPVSAAYTTTYKMAIYEQGKTYCLAWPTKNHVAASCTNQYIPDTQLSVYMSTAVTSSSSPSDPAFPPTASGWKEVPNLFGSHSNGKIDCLGFQRSPKFCTNMDKALATGCITIPSDAAIGLHTFMWYWVFNPGTTPYITCWDAQVVAPGTGRGAGGVTVALNSLQDTLVTGGTTTTCSTNWAAIAGVTGSVNPVVTGITSTGMEAASTTSGNVSVPITGDTAVISFYPVKIPLSGNFAVAVRYSTNGARALTVDILDANSKWYGKGVFTTNTASNGERTTNIAVSINGNLNNGEKYTLRAWLIDLDLYNKWQIELTKPDANRNSNYTQPWTQEMSRYDVSAVASTDINGGGSSSSTASSDAASIRIGVLWSFIFCIVLLLH